MSFEEDLTKLCGKHGICLTGTLKIRPVGDYESSNIKRQSIIDYGHARDTTGPFLVCDVIPKKPIEQQCDVGFRGYVAPDYRGYECPVSGKWIDGRAAHRENLKRTGCRLLERGEKEEAPKRRQEEINESTAKSARQIAEKIAQNWGC